MPHKKKKQHSKRNQVNASSTAIQVDAAQDLQHFDASQDLDLPRFDVSSTSLKVGLVATAVVASTPCIMSALYEDSIYNAGGPGYPGGVAAGALTLLASPVIGVLAAGVSELSIFVQKKDAATGDLVKIDPAQGKLYRA